jgi:hypothetical protein
MKKNSLIKGVAVAGVVALILGALLPALSAVNF